MNIHFGLFLFVKFLSINILLSYSIHKLNGEIVNMATDLPCSEGKAGLQSETAEVFYKNIEIKEFDEIVPMEE